jgi:hypothetical protein
MDVCPNENWETTNAQQKTRNLNMPSFGQRNEILAIEFTQYLLSKKIKYCTFV